jgi:hypothetical protein
MFTRRLLLLASLALGMLSAGLVQAAPPDFIPAVLAKVWEVQQRHQAGLLARDGVVGVALSQNSAGKPVLRIFTTRPGIQGLPLRLDGQDVEVRVTGRFRAGELALQETPATPAERWPRPVPIGVSVAHPDVTAGTIGAQVFSGTTRNRKVFVLSNNHILAKQNLALIGDPALQPGPIDGGTLADSIGTLHAFQPIVISTTASNTMDAAIALTTLADSDYRTPPDGYGVPRNRVTTAYVGLPVMKYGRTTRQTGGKVVAVNATVLVDYSAGTARFIDQIIIEGDNGGAFSQPGDSGSLVVGASGTSARKAVGLIFAGAGNLSAANRISPILSRFNVKVSGDR